MVQPLASLNVSANEFGSEIDLLWSLPATLPTNYQVYLFQRSGSDVTQQDIDNYFANINNLTNYNYNGLFVFDQLTNDNITSLAVLQVLNGLKYYYKGVIRDQDTGEYSAAIGGNATPGSSIAVSIKDGKDLVAQVIQKMFDSVTDKSGKKIQKSKDIDIVKTYSLLPISKDTVMIERINGNTEARFWGNIWNHIQQNTIMGDMDTDVIRATFITEAGIARRDEIANIFRSRKQFLYLLLKKLGADNVNITIEGDYYNPAFHGENIVGITLIFALVLENKAKVTAEEINQAVISDMTVNSNG